MYYTVHKIINRILSRIANYKSCKVDLSNEIANENLYILRINLHHTEYK